MASKKTAVAAVAPSRTLTPRVTEKAALAANKLGVYTFYVEKETTAREVIAMIKAAHKVTPVKVNFLAIPSKKVFRRGRAGVKKGGRKAYVYLKKGDKIDL